MTFVPKAAHLNMQITKKRKIREINFSNISDSNQSKIKSSKKTTHSTHKANHYMIYLRKCVEKKLKPKALRINIAPQVSVISSTLQIQLEKHN